MDMNNINNAKETIMELNEKLLKWNYEYYVLDNPTVSDKKYDACYDSLIELEYKYPSYKLLNSVTNMIGGICVDYLPKVIHKIPLKSMDKAKTKEALKIWWSKIQGDKIGTLKEDGLSLKVVYDNHVLVEVSTRGGGYEGENITHNAMCIRNLPKWIEHDGYIVIRGEGMMTKKEFNRINSKLEYEDKYKNPRNLCAGTLRNLDNEISKERRCKFIAYEIMNWQNINGIKSKEDMLVYLEVMNFDVVVNRKLETFEDCIRFLNKVSLKKQETGFNLGIDGVIIEANDLSERERLGEKDKFPNWAIAYKFEEDEFETTILDIEWNVSRHGRLNPTYIIETVNIDGTDVSRATANNLDMIKAFEIGIGDICIVRKANEIIPELVENLTRSNTYVIPTECPVCGTHIMEIVSNVTHYLYCSNKNCGNILLRRMDHFCHRDCMNIDGLADGKLEFLIDEGYVTEDFASIYRLVDNNDWLEELKNEEGWGSTSVNKLVRAINNSVEVTLDRFIFALGIPQIGSKTSSDIAEFCNYDAEKFFKLDFDELRSINGIGDTAISSLKESNIKQYYHLLEYLEFVEYEEEVVSSNVLEGKVFCLTGKYNGMSRDEFVNLIISNGGIFYDGIKKNTTHLLVGEKPGKGKITEAESKGNIEILDAEKFEIMLKK